MDTTNQKQWLQGLQSFLNELLKPIIKKDEDRFRYLDRNAMIIWARAFTHETVSPSDNYEDLEYLGDALLKAMFPKYLMKRFPYLHKKEFTELNVAYMSKINQADLARKLGFSQYIRVTGIERAILNLETDVFESFFGALDTVSDSIVEGIGYINCYNMIVHIFSDVEIDQTKGEGNAKTQVIQIFVRFESLPKPQENVDETDENNVKFTVSLTNDHINFLRKYGVIINNAIIGYGEAPTKKEAEFEAYKQAFETLTYYRITTKWAEEAKHELDFSEPSVAQYVPAARARLQKEGYNDMYFFIPRKTVTKKGAVVQLIGVHNNGKHIPLSYIYATDNKNSYRTAKSAVIQMYASGA